MSKPSLLEDSIFQNNYQILSKNLSKSPNIQRYKSLNISTTRQETLKIEMEQSPQLLVEYNILQQLQNHDSFPQICFSEFSTAPHYFTEPCYTSNIKSLIKDLKSFDLTSTVSVFNQIITLLEFLHGIGIIHGNICPSSLAVSEDTSRIILTDFGEAIDSKLTTSIVNESKGRKEISCSFASISAHSGIRRPKDDLESLGYVLVFMLIGKLPWKGEFPKSFSKWQKVFIIKSSKTIKDLCRGCPVEFEQYFNYVRRLKNTDPPDYGYLRETIVNIIPKSSLNKFPWRTYTSKKSEKRKPTKKHTKAKKMKSEKSMDDRVTLDRWKTSENKALVDNMGFGLGSSYENTLVSNELPEFKDRSIILDSRNRFSQEVEITEVKKCKDLCFIM